MPLFLPPLMDLLMTLSAHSIQITLESLWIGTRHGISLYNSGKFTTYSAMDGLGSDLVGAVVQDRDGSFWIGTLGGLTHFANGSFTNYTTQQGLSSNVITALYQDADGTLWIGTDGGGLSAKS